jgi:hypothetical protein
MLYDTMVAETGHSDWDVPGARNLWSYHYLDDGRVINAPIVEPFAGGGGVHLLIVYPIIKIGRIKSNSISG